MKFDKKQIPLILIIVMFFWAWMHPLSKVLVGHVPPNLLSFLRFGLGAIALYIYARLSKKSLKIKREDVLPLALIGLSGISISVPLLFIGLNLTTVTTTSILINTSPIMIAILSPFLIKEVPKKEQIAGILVAFLGMILVVTNGRSFDALLASQYFYGNMLVLASALFVALYVIYGKKYIKKYGGFTASFYTTFFGTVILFFMTLASGEMPEIVKLNLSDWIIIFYLGAIVAGLLFTIYYSSIKYLGTAKASSFKLLIPVYATSLAVLFLGETLSFYIFVGGALVLCGLFLTNKEELV